MRTVTLLACAHAALANKTIAFEKSTEQLVSELGLREFDVLAYHQYDNFTADDLKIDYSHLLSEYYEGSSTVSRISSNRGVLRSTPMRDRTTEEDKEYMQRFIQLKFTIKFLQQTKQFLRYCYYGCWCLPNGASDLGVGTGPPVDDIDRSCREFATCYSCLYNQEIGGTCDEERPGRYVIRGKFDSNGKRYLVCMDPPNTCKRKRCECDVDLAKKLQEYEGQWNIQNHRRLGSPPFSAEEHCRIPVTEVAAAPAADVASTGTLGGGRTDEGRADMEAAVASSSAGGAGGSSGGVGGGEAPGVTINRVVSSVIYGEINGCCGRSPNVHYFREGQKCCGDGEIVDFNAPCSMDFL